MQPFTLPKDKQPLMPTAGSSVDRVWYRWFSSIQQAVGGGTVDIATVAAQAASADVKSSLAQTDRDYGPQLDALNRKVDAFDAFFLSLKDYGPILDSLSRKEDWQDALFFSDRDYGSRLDDLNRKYEWLTAYLLSTTSGQKGPAGANGAAGAAGTPTLITKTTTSGSQSSVTFSSIVSTYTHLWVTIMARGSNASNTIDMRMQFNADTGNNYNSQELVSTGNGGTVSQAQALATSSIRIGDISGANATANYVGSIEVTVQGYSQTTFFKSLEAIGGTGISTSQQNSTLNSGIWLSTVAINAVKVFPSAGNFVDNSIVSLYGIN